MHIFGRKLINKVLFELQSRLVEKNLHRIKFFKETELQNNDLVPEFAMQVNHSQCYISANGFFDINLNLLGSVS